MKAKPAAAPAAKFGTLVFDSNMDGVEVFVDGKTIGRHYAGPNWEYSDGSAVVGKAAGNAPGATANDIPWLKLSVVSQRGSGVLTGITTVQRINTQGGVHAGSCEKAGTFTSAPYRADYVFPRKG